MSVPEKLAFRRIVEFGQAHERGEMPDLKSYLIGIEESLRAEVFAALFKKDREFWRPASDEFHRQKYSREFPEFAELIDELLRGRPVERAVVERTSVNGEYEEEDETMPLPEFVGYKTIGILGRGGQGTVFLVKPTGNSHERFAIKQIAGGTGASDESRARFRKEANAAARLSQHPGIVRMFEINERAEIPFLRMEYIEGEDLESLYSNRRPTNEEVARLMVQIAEAMEHAHLHGIIHRDLKPSNILVMLDGKAKVTDFGIARDLWLEGNLTATAGLLGTPAFMAPEQAKDPKRVSRSADIFAMGAILYFLLTGRSPQNSAQARMVGAEIRFIAPAELNANVAPVLEGICLKCTYTDPTLRYASATQLRADLQAFLDEKIPRHLSSDGKVKSYDVPTHFASRGEKFIVSLLVICFVSVIAQLADLTRDLPLLAPIRQHESLDGSRSGIIDWLLASIGLTAMPPWAQGILLGSIFGLIIFLIPDLPSIRSSSSVGWLRQTYDSSTRTSVGRWAWSLLLAIRFGRWLSVRAIVILVVVGTLGFSFWDSSLVWFRLFTVGGAVLSATIGFFIGLPPTHGGLWIRTRPIEWACLNIPKSLFLAVFLAGLAIFAYSVVAKFSAANGTTLPFGAWTMAEFVYWLVLFYTLTMRSYRHRPTGVLRVLDEVARSKYGVSWWLIVGGMLCYGSLAAGLASWFLTTPIDQWLLTQEIEPMGPYWVGAIGFLTGWVLALFGCFSDQN